MTEGSLPKARTTDLIVQEMGDETLVFDRRTDVAHCLTATASAVWMLCDGTSTRADMVAAVAAIEPQNAEAAVDAALEQLAEKDLLIAGISRRGAIGKMAKYGVGAITVPLVLSVTAPVALAGASNANGTTCTPTSPGVNPDCKSGTCLASTGTGVTQTYCGGCVPNGGPQISNCGTSGNAGTVVSVATNVCCSGKCTRANNGNNNGTCTA